MFDFWLCVWGCLRSISFDKCWKAVMNMLELWRKHAVVVSCSRAASAWSLFCPHVVSDGQRGLNNRISVGADQRAYSGRGAKTSTSFFLILSSPPPIPASLIGGKLRWRKPSVSVLHSLLFLLCACFTPPLCVLCQPSELCVHSDPSAATSQAVWLLLFSSFFFFFFTSIWNLSLTSCLTVVEQLFDPLSVPPPIQVTEFYSPEQSAKLGERSDIVLEHVTLHALVSRCFTWPSLKVDGMVVWINIGY